MPGPIETRLAELGITIPDAPAPAANYVPFVQVGDIVYVSGQVPMADGALIKGKLGDDASVEDGAAAAQACAQAMVFNPPALVTTRQRPPCRQ